ncbi:hypothetical protein ACFE04_000087 [Oxalis oulophora]
MVSESWFRSLWRIPRKHESGPDKVPIGVLAFEAASLMSKIVQLWQSLSDKNIARLREEIKNSVGIKKLVSDDDDFITQLICGELMENMRQVCKPVARLAKKCSDPGLMSFEHAFDVYMKMGADPCGWQCTLRKMEKKVKKMEHFMSLNAKLYQEMEILADFEQTLRTMRSNHVELETLLEYEKKAAWKRQEVKNLREMSLWNRTYDYAIRIIVRSIFTIFGRIKYVFGINQFIGGGDSDLEGIDSDFIYRSQSVSAVLQSSVHPSEERLSRYSSDGITRFASGPLGNFQSGPLLNNSKNPNNFHSGPLHGTGSTAKTGPIIAKSGPISGKNGNLNFFSGPLGKPLTKSSAISGIKKTGKKLWANRGKSTNKKHPFPPNGIMISQGGAFGGCKMTSSTPINDCYVNAKDIHSGNLDRVKDNMMAESSPSIFSSNRRMWEAYPDTLGYAALALHYANVIIVIEKLVASPHLIGHDAREDLYNMLPARVRANLRERLKPYAKTLASSVYDSELACEWTEAMASILEWLAPLAHNMIRWQSERSFEQQSLLSRTNVLLVQTLYFANQDKTEATITELLVGLNYVFRFGRDQTVKVLQEGASSRIFDGCLSLEK